MTLQKPNGIIHLSKKDKYILLWIISFVNKYRHLSLFSNSISILNLGHKRDKTWLIDGRSIIAKIVTK